MRKTVAVGIIKQVQASGTGPEPSGLDKKKRKIYTKEDDESWANIE